MTATQDSRSVEAALHGGQEQAPMFSSELPTPGVGGQASVQNIDQNNVRASSERVADVLRSVENRLSEKKPEDGIAQLSGRIDQFNEQLNKLFAGFSLVTDRLDSLNQRVDLVTAACDAKLHEIESQVSGSAAVVGSGVVGAGVFEVVSTIESRFESLENVFKDQCEKFSGIFENAGKAGGLGVNAAPAVDVAEPAEGQVAGVAEAVPAVQAAPAVNTQNPADQASAALAETTVDELKRELNAKIREAEIEMSINRARSMQERVEFERAQAELERRAATLEAKLAESAQRNADGDQAESGMMGRFKRHLGS